MLVLSFPLTLQLHGSREYNLCEVDERVSRPLHSTWQVLSEYLQKECQSGLTGEHHAQRPVVKHIGGGGQSQKCYVQAGVLHYGRSREPR